MGLLTINELSGWRWPWEAPSHTETVQRQRDFTDAFLRARSAGPGSLARHRFIQGFSSRADRDEARRLDRVYAAADQKRRRQAYARETARRAALARTVREEQRASLREARRLRAISTARRTLTSTRAPVQFLAPSLPVRGGSLFTATRGTPALTLARPTLLASSRAFAPSPTYGVF